LPPRADAGHQTARLKSGQLVYAIPAGRRILTDAERALGPDHPATLMARNNLGGAYRTTGQTGQAIEAFERALIDAERTLGPDHPTTRAIRRNLTEARESDDGEA
jgi:hypothetical protein